MPRPKSPATLRRERLDAAERRLESLYSDGALYRLDRAEFLTQVADEIEARRTGQDPAKRVEYLGRLHYLACGDGSCRIGKRQGQHTNGGCCCFGRTGPAWREPWPPETQKRVLEALQLWRTLALCQELTATKEPG